MQTTNSVHSWKLIRITGIVAIFLICWFTGITFGTEQPSMQIGFTEQGTAALTVRMASAPVCSLLTLDPQTFRLKIPGVTESRLKKVASPLWQFFPVEILRETNADQSYLMDFRIPGGENHPVVSRNGKAGISILFDGEVAQNTWEKTVAYGSRQYSALQPAEQQQLTAALDSMPVAPRDPVLLRILQQARQHKQYGWYNKVYSKVYHRQPAGSEDVLALARYFEHIGDTGAAGIEWYEYYQRIAAAEASVYTDDLPPGSHVVEEKIQTGIAGRDTRKKARAWWWIAVVPVLTGVGVGSRWLYHRVNRSGNSTPEAEEESLGAVEFQSFLEEINQKLRTEQAAGAGEEAVARPKESGEMAPDPAGVSAERPEEETRADRIRERLKNYPERQRMQDILPKQSRVYTLSQMDMAPDLIAKKLNMSRGEVELLLKIGNQTEHEANTTLRKERMVSEQFAHESVRELSRHMHISEEEAKLLRLKRWGN